MSEHKKILKLIENVDPEDSDALDEIDARFMAWARLIPDKFRDEAWVVNWELYEARLITTRWWGVCLVHTDGKTGAWWRAPKYTRSRDALKAIRPEGWFITTSQTIRGAECSMVSSSGRGMVKSHLPTKTEELAELHAIIQAVAYERGLIEEKKSGVS